MMVSVESAALLIANARRRSELTQAQLAARAGVTQSVISAYESGRREPSLRMLTKLVGATGLWLEIRVSAASPASARLRRRVEERRSGLVEALHSLGATSVSLFGSVARGDAGDDSDIDLLVDVGESVTLLDLARMQAEAERILETAVDVVPADSLKPSLRTSVRADAVLL
jgi:uncharacterized protein